MTSFDSIYCLNHTIKQDQRLQKLPIYKYYSLCWKYLQFAISYFQYDCLPASGSTTPKVLNYSPFQELDYNFFGDGVSSTFFLNPAPPENSLFNVSYQKAECGEIFSIPSSEYSFDASTNVLTVNIPPINIYQLFVNAFSIGYFNDDLDLREQNILAEGMIIPWQEETLNDYMLRKQMIYNDSSKIHSQANQQLENRNTIQYQYDKLNTLITEYSYKSNTEKYGGLSGTKTVGVIQ